MKLKAALIGLIAAAQLTAGTIGWVAEVQVAPAATTYWYSLPDPDYSHFIFATVQPLINFDEFWAKLSQFDKEVYWKTFDCGCTVYDPTAEVPPVSTDPTTAPEPATWAVAAAGLAVAVSRRKV